MAVQGGIGKLRFLRPKQAAQPSGAPPFLAQTGATLSFNAPQGTRIGAADIFPNLVVLLAVATALPAGVQRCESAPITQVAVQVTEQLGSPRTLGIPPPIVGLPLSAGRQIESAPLPRAVVQVDYYQNLSTSTLKGVPLPISAGRWSESAPLPRPMVVTDHPVTPLTLGIPPPKVSFPLFAGKQTDSAPIPRYTVQIDILGSPATLGTPPPIVPLPLSAGRQTDSAPSAKCAVSFDQYNNLVVLIPTGVAPAPAGKQQTDSAPIGKYAVQVDSLGSFGLLGTPPPLVPLPLSTGRVTDSAPPAKPLVVVDQPVRPINLGIPPPLVPLPLSAGRVQDSASQARYIVGVDQYPNLIILVPVGAVALPPGRQQVESAPLAKYAVQVDLLGSPFNLGKLPPLVPLPLSAGRVTDSAPWARYSPQVDPVQYQTARITPRPTQLSDSAPWARFSPQIDQALNLTRFITPRPTQLNDSAPVGRYAVEIDSPVLPLALRVGVLNPLLNLEDAWEHWVTDDADDYYVDDLFTLINSQAVVAMYGVGISMTISWGIGVARQQMIEVTLDPRFYNGSNAWLGFRRASGGGIY